MSKIQLIKGDDATLTFTFKENGVAINITGYKVFFTVKKKVDDLDTAAVIKKDWTVHSDPTHGITQLLLTSTETNIEARNYFWDLQIKSPGGAISSTSYGELEVTQDITLRTT